MIQTKYDSASDDKSGRFLFPPMTPISDYSSRRPFELKTLGVLLTSSQAITSAIVKDNCTLTMHADVQVGPLGRSLFYLKAQCTRNISSSSNEVYPTTTLWRLKRPRHRTRALFQICDPFSVDCITVKSGYYFLTTELPSFDCKRVNPDQQFAITVESVSVAQSTVYFAIYSELHEEYCIEGVDYSEEFAEYKARTDQQGKVPDIYFDYQLKKKLYSVFASETSTITTTTTVNRLLLLDKTSTAYHLSVLERLRPSIVSMQSDLNPAIILSLESARYHSHVAGLVGGVRRAAYAFTLAGGQSCRAEVNILSPSSKEEEEELHLKMASTYGAHQYPKALHAKNMVPQGNLDVSSWWTALQDDSILAGADADSLQHIFSCLALFEAMPLGFTCRRLYYHFKESQKKKTKALNLTIGKDITLELLAAATEDFYVRTSFSSVALQFTATYASLRSLTVSTTLHPDNFATLLTQLSALPLLTTLGLQFKKYDNSYRSFPLLDFLWRPLAQLQRHPALRHLTLSLNADQWGESDCYEIPPLPILRQLTSFTFVQSGRQLWVLSKVIEALRREEHGGHLLPGVGACIGLKWFPNCNFEIMSAVPELLLCITFLELTIGWSAIPLDEAAN
ncbi:hypothetical protein TYRP_022634 [Tyrophagus putrescentiae]|nr:hypothetical protein TYRP_022634 [Tyrophagus putrescentiae]